MSKEYFHGRNEKEYITFRERVTLFFQEVHAWPELCSDQKQASDLLQKINTRIEFSAFNHNQMVRYLTKNNNLSLKEMEMPSAWFKKILGFESLIHVTYSTKQYFLTGINGAIEIHQKIAGLSIFDQHHLYNDRKNQTLILKRPGTDLKDVWGNDLKTPIEEFSSRPEVFGFVKISTQTTN